MIYNDTVGLLMMLLLMNSCKNRITGGLVFFFGNGLGWVDLTRWMTLLELDSNFWCPRSVIPVFFPVVDRRAYAAAIVVIILGFFPRGSVPIATFSFSQ